MGDESALRQRKIRHLFGRINQGLVQVLAPICPFEWKKS
jgi:hypothetical protein